MAAWDSIKLFYNVTSQFFTVKPDSIRHPVAHVSENTLDTACLGSGFTGVTIFYEAIIINMVKSPGIVKPIDPPSWKQHISELITT
jgi:hypothetical protein